MKSDRGRLLALMVLVAAALFFVIQGRFLPGTSQRQTEMRPDDLVAGVMRLIRTDYVEEPDPARTTDGAFRGLVNSLDPLSSYLDRAATARYLSRESLVQETGAVVFKRHNTFPQVVSVLEGSPAAKAGLKPGDAVSGIEGRSPLAWSLIEVRLALREVESRPVRLRVITGAETRELAVERAVLFPKAAEILPGDKDGLILKVHRFSPQLLDEIRKDLLPRLRGRKGPLVVDLRDATDGDPDEALKFLRLFVKGEKLGWFEKKGGARQIVTLKEEPELGRTPLAVWINAGAMGPAEIVAGVLQEALKVRVVGQETPGLAAREEIFPLPDESSVLLTSAVFTLASGRKLWEKGVVPDYRVPPDNQDRKAYAEKTKTIFPAF
jgi:carboxyl-terminal processing protease